MNLEQRQKVAHLAAEDPAFRQKLRDDPRAAILDATGYAVPQDVSIDLVEESRWRRVMVVPWETVTGKSR